MVQVLGIAGESMPYNVNCYIPPAATESLRKVWYSQSFKNCSQCCILNWTTFLAILHAK